MFLDLNQKYEIKEVSRNSALVNGMQPAVPEKSPVGASKT